MGGQGNFSLLCMLLITLLGMCSAQEEMAAITVTRGREDQVKLATQDGACPTGRCPERAPNFQVEEGLCVDNSILQGGCNVQLVPDVGDAFSTSSLLSFIAENGSLMVLDSATNQYGVGRLHDRGGTRQVGMDCDITRLTLLRGNRSVLLHNGFTVTSGSQIKISVDEENLAYLRRDYDGEVYQVDIICSNNSEVNCVVFKLNGTADLTREKFNHLVPPRALGLDNPCFSSSPLTTTSMPTNTTDIFDDPILQLITIVSACGVGLLLCLILSVSAVGCYFHHRSKQSCSSTKYKAEELRETTGDLLILSCNLAYGSHQSAEKGKPQEVDQSSLLYEAIDKPDALVDKPDAQLCKASDQPGAQKNLYEVVNKFDAQSLLYEAVDKPDAQEKVHEVVNKSDAQSLLYEAVDKPDALVDKQSLHYEVVDKPDAREKVHDVVNKSDAQNLLYEEMNKPGAQKNVYEAVDKSDDQSLLYEAMGKPAVHKAIDKPDTQELLYEKMDGHNTGNLLYEDMNKSGAHNCEAMEKADNQTLVYEAVDKPEAQNFPHKKDKLISQKLLGMAVDEQYEAVDKPDSHKLAYKAQKFSYTEVHKPSMRNPLKKELDMPNTQNTLYEAMDDDISEFV